MTIKYIGDLSIQDAKELHKNGLNAKSILEFGVGGSTQIFAQCKPECLSSVETDPKWVLITQKRLTQLDDITMPLFFDYGKHPQRSYDLIFVDGIDNLRKQFAIDNWKLLSVGGKMIFHDTRRFQDFVNAAWIAQLFFQEVKQIDVNVGNSNLTVIHKQEKQPYVNWNYTEGKPMWAYGGIDNTEEKPLWTLQN